MKTNKSVIREAVRQTVRKTLMEIANKEIIKEGKSTRKKVNESYLSSYPIMHSKPFKIAEENGVKLYMIGTFKAMLVAQNYMMKARWALGNEHFFNAFQNKGRLYLVTTENEKYCVFVNKSNNEIEEMTDHNDEHVNPNEILSQNLIDKMTHPFGKKNDVKEGKSTRKRNTI